MSDKLCNGSHGWFYYHKAHDACVPKFGPEEINIAVVAERQVFVEVSIEDIPSKIQRLAINLERLLAISIKDISTASKTNCGKHRTNFSLDC